MDIISDAVDCPVENITSFFPNKRGIQVSMLRLDMLHPVVSGNKWFKLKYNLEAARIGGFQQIITFGGAYSNHLIATAAAAACAGLSSIGIVRGLHTQQALTHTLTACLEYGMRLHFVRRQDYARKKDPEYLASLINLFGQSFVIPEGGDNELGRKGACDIHELIPAEASMVCLPVGTGTTFTGLCNALYDSKKLIGFTAIKGGEYLQAEIAAHTKSVNWWLETAFAFGGFAKTTPELIQFIRQFYQHTHIPLDVVYTGKMMFGIRELIAQHAFSEGEHICCIHTGGLQGNPVGLFL